jgi:hypothetical protein
MVGEPTSPGSRVRAAANPAFIPRPHPFTPVSMSPRRDSDQPFWSKPVSSRSRSVRQRTFGTPRSSFKIPPTQLTSPARRLLRLTRGRALWPAAERRLVDGTLADARERTRMRRKKETSPRAPTAPFDTGL